MFHYTRVCLQLQSLLIAIANRQGGEFPLAVFLCSKIDIEINKNMLNGRSFNPSKASRIQMCRWFRYFLGSINNLVYQKFCNPSWQAILGFQSLQNLNPNHFDIIYCCQFC